MKRYSILDFYIICVALRAPRVSNGRISIGVPQPLGGKGG